MPTYTVIESKKITPSTLLLSLARDESERPLAFQPGQYAAISFEHSRHKSPARCFSIVTPPTDQDTLQFSMRVRGRYTTAVLQLQKDDLVDVSGPFGGFVLDTGRDMKAVFMAGGIGITPFMSMMRYLARLNAENDVVLLYSCQTQDDIPFKDELLEIERRHPNLKVMFVIGKGPVDQLPAKQAATGFISPELLDKVTAGKYSDQRFFVCGPPVFMKAMQAAVMKKGVPRSRIMTEAFTQSSPKQTSILRSWPANVYVIGAVGMVLGSYLVMISDLLKLLPPTSTDLPTQQAPFLITNARQQQLDQLVNTIPPSASVITAPADTPVPTASPAASTATPASAPPPSFAPVYIAPRTTASTPPP